MEIFTKQIEVYFYKDGDFSCRLDALADVLDNLEDTEAFFRFLLIVDLKMREYLERKNIIKTNARGGSYLFDKAGREQIMNFIAGCKEG